MHLLSGADPAIVNVVTWRPKILPRKLFLWLIVSYISRIKNETVHLSYDKCWFILFPGIFSLLRRARMHNRACRPTLSFRVSPSLYAGHRIIDRVGSSFKRPRSWYLAVLHFPPEICRANAISELYRICF